MKIVKALFLVGVSLNSLAQNTWEHLTPKPSINPGNDICFVNNEKGFIITSEELIITTDTGTTWQIADKSISGNKIKFRNSVGYIIGNSGAIYKSLDAGDHWSLLTTLNGNLNSITLVDEDTLRITTRDSLYTSDDGGISWTSYAIPCYHVEDLYFTSSQLGHVACSNGTIQKTIDGGQSWYETATSNLPFHKITFINENIGYASTAHNYLETRDFMKSIDGGETWNIINSADGKYAIHFINDTIGFVAGGDGDTYTLQKTLDGGDSWKEMTYDVGYSPKFYGSKRIYSIYFLDERVGFATTRGGMILKTIDGGTSWQAYSQIQTTIKGLQLTSENVGYFIQSETQELFKTSDNGQSWEPVSNSHQTILFLNDSVGYSVMSDNSTITKTTDGAITWDTLPAANLESIRSVFFLDENVGFASDNLNLMKTVDGGLSWNLLGEYPLDEINFTSDLIGYAKSGRSIYKSSNGGESWEQIISIDRGSIRSLQFVNDSVAFISVIYSRGGGEIFRTFDSGESWEKFPFDNINQFKFYSNYLGYAFEYFSGRLYRTLNGGENWKYVTVTPGPDIGGTEASITFNDLDIYFYGQYGLMRRSKINFSDLINIDPPSVISTTALTATVSTEITSSLSETVVNIELGKQSGNYEQSFILGTFYEHLNKVEYVIQSLEPSIDYFCRLSVTHNDSTVYGDEISFRTDVLGNELKQQKLIIYPNPASNIMRIHSMENQLLDDYAIFSIDGKLMDSGEMKVNFELDISHLRTGIYLLRMIAVDGSLVTKKFVKN